MKAASCKRCGGTAKEEFTVKTKWGTEQHMLCNECLDIVWTVTNECLDRHVHRVPLFTGNVKCVVCGEIHVNCLCHKESQGHVQSVT